MKAMLFAAGRGERMRPLTDATPKPLLPVGGKPLIAWQLERLAAAGIREVVVNTSHLADRFPAALGDGGHWGLRLHLLYEGPEPLETGGGILNALPLLGEAPFLVVNGDVWCDVDLATLPREPAGLGHLVLVDNPPHHPRGDFALDAQGLVRRQGEPRLTYAGIGVFRPALLQGWESIAAPANAGPGSAPRFKLAPLLFAAADRGLLGGQHHRGEWVDVGTRERLAELDRQLGGVRPA
jgi:N-acetyl-alpha-D-muramate 1-phosphate uridylyltransferase